MAVKKRKEKLELVKNTKSKNIVDVFPSLNDTSDNLLEVWQQEIETLTKGEYMDLNSAIDSVVQAVIDRMSSNINSSDPELKSFLKFYLESDPTIIETIEKSLLKK